MTKFKQKSVILAPNTAIYRCLKLFVKDFYVISLINQHHKKILWARIIGNIKNHIRNQSAKSNINHMLKKTRLHHSSCSVDPWSGILTQNDCTKTETSNKMGKLNRNIQIWIVWPAQGTVTNGKTQRSSGPKQTLSLLIDFDFNLCFRNSAFLLNLFFNYHVYLPIFFLLNTYLKFIKSWKSTTEIRSEFLVVHLEFTRSQWWMMMITVDDQINWIDWMLLPFFDTKYFDSFALPHSSQSPPLQTGVMGTSGSFCMPEI